MVTPRLIKFIDRTGEQMSNSHRSRIGAALLALALVTAACSSGASAGSGDEAGAQTTVAEATVSGELSSAQVDAFKAALLNGNGSESMSACLFDKVQEGLDAGDLTPQQIVDWTEGRGFDGPVQDYISQVDIVMECSSAG